MHFMRSYLALSRELEKQLQTASHGDPVPSENQLASQYRISRLTARAVLQDLERRHVVRRVQGLGTFVTRRLDYRIDSEGPASFTEIVRAAGGDPATTTDSVAVRAPTRAERSALELSGRGEKVIEIRRCRWLDGEPVGIGSSILPLARVPDLSDLLEEGQSLYSLLSDHYKLKPKRAWFRCEVVTAPDEVAERLDLKGRPDLFHNQGRLESARLGLPIELQDGWLRTDVFNVVIEVGTFK